MGPRDSQGGQEVLRELGQSGGAGEGGKEGQEIVEEDRGWVWGQVGGCFE